MATPKTRRLVNAIALVLGVSGFFFTPALFYVIYNPSPLFPYAAGDGNFVIHSTEPLDPGAAADFAAQAWAALEVSTLGAPDHPVHAYVTGEGWRRFVFFRPAPEAAGIAYPLLSQRHFFLRGADVEQGFLIYDGEIRDQDIRDLIYYFVHETTHLRHSEQVGVLNMRNTPRWIQEGLADFAALGPAPREMQERAMSGLPLPRETYGSYPIERVCVTDILARDNMRIDHLLAGRMTLRSESACGFLPPGDSD